MEDLTLSSIPGQIVVLAEMGGYAECLVISRTDEPEWIAYKIRFTKIIVQYPIVEFENGDELEIGCNPSYHGMYDGWSFEGVEA